MFNNKTLPIMYIFHIFYENFLIYTSFNFFYYIYIGWLSRPKETRRSDSEFVAKQVNRLPSN